MVVNVGYSPTNPTGMKNFGQSCEDAQDKDDWRLRIKEASQKTALKQCVRVMPT